MPRTSEIASAGTRESQRLETRRRVFDAAVAEFARTGTAETEIGAVVEAAGVARGTFYFHFPTKEHVLVELESREEERIAARLRRSDEARSDGLAAVLAEVVREVLAAERRLGPGLFRDMLSLHFSPTRPVEDQIPEHPLAQHVIGAVRDVQKAGGLAPGVDPAEAAVVFLTGLFAVLATSQGPSMARARLIEHFVATTTKGLEGQ